MPVGGHPVRIELYLRLSDTMGFQSYPVPFEPLSSTHNVLTRVRGLQEKVGSQAPLIGNLQTFAWERGRLPSGEEVRNMTYQSLITGVRGILYYTYFDLSTDLNMQPKLWWDMGRLAREIHQIEPFLLKGDRDEIDTRDGWVFAATWKLDGQLLLVVTNTHDKETREVSLSLPVSASSSLADANRIRGRNEPPAREGHRGVESLSGGQLTLSLQPKEARVLQFDLR